MTDPSMSRPIIHQRSPHNFVNTFGSSASPYRESMACGARLFPPAGVKITGFSSCMEPVPMLSSTRPAWVRCEEPGTNRDSHEIDFALGSHRRGSGVRPGGDGGV